MVGDIRYLELKFLTAVAEGKVDLFDQRNQQKVLGSGSPAIPYVEMAATLIEELYIRFENDEVQLFVSRLRGELFNSEKFNSRDEHLWNNPRKAILDFLSGTHRGLYHVCITFRGLRRIQELRDALRYDRILEPHGVLLSMQYFRRDLEDALKSKQDDAVSVISADMDDFKRINTESGHDAGDVVMKAYLECVRDGLNLFGTAYRGVGDEVLALVVGQGHKIACDLAEGIRKRVSELVCEFKGKRLHRVTASLGVATTPPENRTMDIESVAKERGYRAKKEGKNCVISR